MSEKTPMLISEARKNLLENVALILRWQWQTKASVLIEKHGIKITLNSGETLFFENKEDEDANSASDEALS